jgi:hypothetical protein
MIAEVVAFVDPRSIMRTQSALIRGGLNATTNRVHRAPREGGL